MVHRHQILTVTESIYINMKGHKRPEKVFVTICILSVALLTYKDSLNRGGEDEDTKGRDSARFLV